MADEPLTQNPDAYADAINNVSALLCEQVCADPRLPLPQYPRRDTIRTLGMRLLKVADEMIPGNEEHPPPEPPNVYEGIQQLLALTKKGLNIMAALDDAIAAIGTQVTQITTVDQSVIALLTSLNTQLQAALAAAAAAGATPAQLSQLNDFAAALAAQATSLASAVTANTPKTK